MNLPKVYRVLNFQKTETVKFSSNLKHFKFQKFKQNKFQKSKNINKQ